MSRRQSILGIFLDDLTKPLDLVSDTAPTRPEDHLKSYVRLKQKTKKLNSPRAAKNIASRGEFLDLLKKQDSLLSFLPDRTRK
jgi:hypothetical protein